MKNAMTLFVFLLSLTSLTLQASETTNDASCDLSQIKAQVAKLNDSIHLAQQEVNTLKSHGEKGYKALVGTVSKMWDSGANQGIHCYPHSCRVSRMKVTNKDVDKVKKGLNNYKALSDDVDYFNMQVIQEARVLELIMDQCD